MVLHYSGAGCGSRFADRFVLGSMLTAAVASDDTPSLFQWRSVDSHEHRPVKPPEEAPPRRRQQPPRPYPPLDAGIKDSAGL